MKALFLTHRVPYPPDRGDRIRSYHLLRFLAGRADMSLACMTEEPVSNTVRQQLESQCERVAICPTSAIGRTTRAAWSLARGRSATEGYFWHPQLAATLAAWSKQQEFHVVICYCSGMYRYTHLPCLAQVPVVVDLVDVDSQKWKDCAESAGFPRRWLYHIESYRICDLEREIAAKASAITVISKEEKAAFARVAPNTNVQIVPNGVDLEFFRPPTEPSTVEPNTCCFVGVLNYQPNVDGLCWFVERVWPRVRNAVPSAQFLIIGKSPGAAVRRLAAVPGVKLHADVPDVRPFLAKSAVVVIPLRIARGLQNKVLEAMAMGKAVLATSAALTGLEGLSSDTEVMRANDADQWTSNLLQLFADTRLANRLGATARGYVERYLNWFFCLQPMANTLRVVISEVDKRPADRKDSNEVLERSL